MITVVVGRTWDGHVLPAAERASLHLSWRGQGEGRALVIRIDAPFHDDPAPSGPPGPTDRLWEHEVVELFVLGPEQHYTEVELGPHGHHLVLELVGVRQPVRDKLPIAYEARIDGQRWTGTARIDASLLPAPAQRFNAYRIHGVGAARTYHAVVAVPGDQPDFHRLDRFAPWPV